MVHQHGAKHLVRRQRLSDFLGLKEPEPDVEVEEATVFVTMPNTFSGPVVWKTVDSSPSTAVGGAVKPTVTLGEPVIRTRTSSQDEDTTAQATSAAGQSSRVTAHASSSVSPSPLKFDTSSMPVMSTSAVSSVVAAIASTSAAPTSTASAEAASSGMSGGTKAGIALGIIVVIGAILGFILFVAHLKKKERAARESDNEKAASMHEIPPPPITKEPTNAPRLSLRPVTQFDPTFPSQKSPNNLLGIGAGAGAAASANRSPEPERAGSAWERRGAANANAASAPINPFSDPENPFTNKAAIETPEAPAPAAPNADFGNPAPAIAAAEKAPVAAPLPTSQAINLDAALASPALTEDIPASPGPAPSGPLPVAAAGVASPAPNNVHRVQLDFKPSMGDELELRAGQLVRMLHEYDDGWALCIRMDRSQQGVVPRTCISKHPVKPRQAPPRQGPMGSPRMRGPPVNGPNGNAGAPYQPRPISPANGRSSPHPTSLSPANGRMSPAPRSMSPGPRQMSPPQGRVRSNSNAPYAGQPRSMSPGPYGGGPQMARPPQMGRPRSNSASQVSARRASPPGPSPMNPNAGMQMPPRKPIPGQAL